LALGSCGAVILAAALAASPASAQTTPAQPPAPAQKPEPGQQPEAGQKPEPAQPPPPATTPPPHKFTGSATVGVSLESGRTDLIGAQVMFDGRRPYSATGSFDASFAYTRAEAGHPGGHGPRETVADRLTATFDVEQNYGKRLVMMLRAQALRDPIAQINYRFGEMAGLGVRLENARVQARLVPGVAFLTDDMHMVDDGFRVHFGLYEDLNAKIGPVWTFSQFLGISRDVTQADDYIVNLDAKLTGAITKHLGIQLSYLFNYEKMLPPGVEPSYQKTIAGLQITF
jgi:hypothetical protein